MTLGRTLAFSTSRLLAIGCARYNRCIHGLHGRKSGDNARDHGQTDQTHQNAAQELGICLYTYSVHLNPPALSADSPEIIICETSG